MSKFDAFFLPTEVPPSLDGRVFDCEEGDDLLMSVKRAMTRTRDAAQKSLDVARAEMDNELNPPARQHYNVREASGKLMRPAFEALDDARAKLATKIGEIANIVAAPPPPTDARGEIRLGHLLDGLRSIPQSERLKTVLEAVKTSDELANAVLRYPPIVSGLTQDQLDLVSLAWGEAHYPDKMRRLEELRKAEQHLERARALAQNFTNRLYSIAMLEEADRRAKATAEALKGWLGDRGEAA